VTIAWVAAMVGGMGGWLVGLRAGRAVLTAPGPLHRLRLAALERGDRFYERFGAVAVFFTPSWVAGIHGMKPSRFLPANAVAALVWALLLGMGAYLAGPPIVDLVDDVGVVAGVILIGLVIAAVVGGIRSQKRRRGRAR
jgi:membrane protein DedA with SNARE-associated domain